jgi:hypothetical protein
MTILNGASSMFSSGSGASLRAFDFSVRTEANRHQLACRIEGPNFPDELVYTIESSTGLPPANPEHGDWAAVALLYPAMLASMDLVLEATVSRRLLHAMQGDMQALLSLYDSRLKRIQVRAEPRQSDEAAASGRIATGFSAGIDSFATLRLYSGNENPLHVTDLTVHDVGAFGHLRDSRQGFDFTRRRAAAFADSKGYGFYSVESNLAPFFRAGDLPSSVFENSHTLRNASAAHALQSVLGVFLYSSTYPYQEIGLYHATQTRPLSTAYLDPILLPLLSSERLTLLSAGAGLSRAEKTALIADDPDAQAMLDVCVAPEQKRQEAERPNCSACFKCVRTMFTLEAFGKLDLFHTRFNIDAFRRNRRAGLLTLQKKAALGSSVDREVLALLSRHGIRPPFNAGLALRLFRQTLSRVKSALLQ